MRFYWNYELIYFFSEALGEYFIIYSMLPHNILYGIGNKTTTQNAENICRYHILNHMHCAYLVWHPQKRKVMKQESFCETGGEANCSNLLLSLFLNCLVESIRIPLNKTIVQASYIFYLIFLCFVEWRVCTDYYYYHLLRVHIRPLEDEVPAPPGAADHDAASGGGGAGRGGGGGDTLHHGGAAVVTQTCQQQAVTKLYCENFGLSNY